MLSNELPDAFPVHRFAMRDGRVLEAYVTLEDGRLGEVLGEPSTPRIGQRLSALGLELADGFRGEVNLALDDWMEEASRGAGARPRPDDRLRPRGEGPLLVRAVGRYAPLLLRSHPAGRPVSPRGDDRT